MPACASGLFWNSIDRETGRLGHLYSPRDQRGPWPWLPYACDNGAFSCWNPADNTFDEQKWAGKEHAWRELLIWCQCAPIKPRWAIVPDVPGNSEETLKRWPIYAKEVVAAQIPLAIAVQDGMTPEIVRSLTPLPEVICVGGTTEWKWETAEMWCKEFPRVHILRVNSPTKVPIIEAWGAESCDGTGWNRGDRRQTAGLEEWCRARATPTSERLWPFASRARDAKQLCFA